MRLLVTNTHTPQAYAIIRALRPHAEWIVATMYGPRGLATLISYSAHSRLVDRRFRVPSPEVDWLSGHVQPENTDKEEAYLRAVLDICERERIDTIFPSYDPQVYVLSKNKERLGRLGIRTPVPEFETLLLSLDKHRTIGLAEKAGFPCPRTFLPRTDADIEAIADRIGPPWVVKPRVSTASKGMEIVTDRDRLVEKTRRVGRDYERPMIQEYIPGAQKQNFYVMVDRSGETESIFCPRIVRHSRRLYRNSSAAALSSVEHEAIPLVRRLVRELGWKGALTVQTKIDARDGVPKLMEINPRLGSHLWYRTELGVNEPLRCLRIEGNEPLPEPERFQPDTLLLEPIEDVVGFMVDILDLIAYKSRVLLFRKKPADVLNAPLSLKLLVRSYSENYLGRHRKRYSPHFRYFLSDPLTSALYSLYAARYAPGGLKRLGQ